MLPAPAPGPNGALALSARGFEVTPPPPTRRCRVFWQERGRERRVLPRRAQDAGVCVPARRQRRHGGPAQRHGGAPPGASAGASSMQRALRRVRALPRLTCRRARSAAVCHHLPRRRQAPRPAKTAAKPCAAPRGAGVRGNGPAAGVLLLRRKAAARRPGCGTHLPRLLAA